MFASHIPRYVSFKVIWREGMKDSDSLFLGLLNVNIKVGDEVQDICDWVLFQRPSFY